MRVLSNTTFLSTVLFQVQLRRHLLHQLVLLILNSRVVQSTIFHLITIAKVVHGRLLSDTTVVTVASPIISSLVKSSRVLILEVDLPLQALVLKVSSLLLLAEEVMFTFQAL